MNPKATHLCLVSDQPVPSLTPLIDPQLAVAGVVLVHAPERAAQAGWLAEALRRQGISASLAPLADGYDLPRLRGEFAAIAARFPDGVVANITGGTKMMTLAAWETFDRPADRLYYVDIRHDSIRWLRPEAPEQPVADRLRLEAYVTALGLRLHPKKKPLRKSPTAGVLADARNRLQLLAGLKQRKSRSPGGTWLEELVFAEAEALMGADPKIQDVARQFVVDDDGHHNERIENEIDVAVLRDNTLFLIECKTGGAGRAKPAADAIAKLAMLVDGLGGLRGRGLFVTTELISGPMRERARKLGVQVIERYALRDLRAVLAGALRQPLDRTIEYGAV